MATSSTTSHAISKWLANKSLKISLNRRKSKSGSRSPSSSSSTSSLSSPNNSPRNDNNMITTTTISPGKREDELRLVFRRFDTNDDGKISALELRSYFGSIGEYLSHEQAKAMIEDFDANGDESLDFQEFLRLMKRDDETRDELDRDLKNAFEIFELENGCITPRSVQRMLQRLGDARSYDECKAMVRAFDKDGNGVLDFNEFHQMMA